MTWAVLKRFSVHKQYTAAQTGVALYTPPQNTRTAVYHITITPTGGTGGAVTVWWGATADTTYTIGTDQPLVAGTLTPNGTGPAFTGGEQLKLSAPEPYGVVSFTGGHVLRLTTVGDIDLDIVIHGAEVA